MRKLLFPLIASIFLLVGVANTATHIFISGGGGAGGINTSLATWDQITESGWGDANTYIALFTGSDSANEIGQGVLSGVDLVLLQIGAVAAAQSDGTYFYRLNDNTNDGFEFTDTWFNGLFGGKSAWTLILKQRYMGFGAWSYQFVANDTDLYFYIQTDPTGVLYVTLDDAGGASSEQYTANTMSGDGSTDTFIAVWCDGVNTYGGFTSGEIPTKKSDFAAGSLLTFPRAISFANMSTGSYRHVWGDGGITGGNVRMYGIVASKTCLIDNGS